MIADEPTLQKWGATNFEGCVQYKGWTFKSCKSVISNENSLTTLAKRISSSFHGAEHPERDDDRIEVNGALLHLPCMVFGNNILSLQAPETTTDNYKISFVASDALKLWAMEHATAAAKGEPLKLLKVPFAWSQQQSSSGTADCSKAQDGTSIATATGEEPSTPARHTQWDWTFSTHDYCCTIAKTSLGSRVSTKSAIVGAKRLSAAAGTGAASSTSAAGAIDNTAAAATASAPATVFGFLESLETSSGDARSSPAKAGKGSGSSSASKSTDEGKEEKKGDEGDDVCAWEVIEQSGIDGAMLRVQDDILFYDDVTLYQDDLEDCGEVTLSVKTRVMPRCWFVLQRMYLRIDKGTIRVRDTRMFHDFSSGSSSSGDDSNSNSSSSGGGGGSGGYVYMDVTWHEGSMETIEANMPPSAGPGGMFVAHIPAPGARPVPGPAPGAAGMRGGGRLNYAAIRSDPSSIMRFIPLVNEQEGVSQFHRLRL